MTRAPIFSLRTRVLLAFGLALAVLGALGVGAWDRNSRTITGVSETMRSNREASLINGLEDALTDADRAARDFVYQGLPNQLADFQVARATVTRHMQSLEAMMRADSAESRTLAELAPLVVAKLEFTAATLTARQGPDGSRAAFQLITTGRGWELTDSIRHHLTTLGTREDAELADRAHALVASARTTRTIATVSILATLLVMGLGVFGILREVDARAGAQRELAASSALLREAYDELRDLYDNAPCGYHSIDDDGLVVRMNDTELHWLGYERDEVIGRLHITDLMTPADAEGSPARMRRLKDQGYLNDVELNYLRKDGTILPVLTSTTCVRDAQHRFLMTRTVITDISEIRRAQDETVKAVADLADALASVRTLTGMLPICSLCKSVRDDRGYWANVEQYVSAHTDAKFSHGVCPDCFPKMFPGIELEPQPSARG